MGLAVPPSPNQLQEDYIHISDLSLDSVILKGITNEH
jgi:hypothetical protein